MSSNIEFHNHSLFGSKIQSHNYSLLGSLSEGHDNTRFCNWLRLLAKVERITVGIQWVLMLCLIYTHGINTFLYLILIYKFFPSPGATGFLGSFLLSQLLSSNDKVVIYCLVRCGQEVEGAFVIVCMYCRYVSNYFASHY